MLRSFRIVHVSAVSFAWTLVLVTCCCVIGQTDSPANTEISNTQELSIPMTPPDQALAMLELPEGFKATLFAAEPDVHQPVAATFDDRGRLWVVECYTYSDRKENYNTKLNDRIVILEDADNDGVFDKRTIFWDQGKKLMGIEYGFGGVWVTAAPNLLFIPDRDGDDVPDGEPEIMLDGFDDDAARHNVVNGPKWGPDGWLYGRHGILATSYVGVPGATDSQRVPINCGIWRFHPVNHKFEVVAHGGTNPWGFDFDEHGEMYMINTVIGHLFHVVPNARFRRMSGSHFNPHTYQVIEQTADHFHWDVGKEDWTAQKRKGVSDGTDAAGGGHAHSGLMIYQGDNWPEEFRGKLFTLNFHGRRMNSESLHREGNSYVARHGKDYFKTKDPWFRGVDLFTGPDGGVFVLDWSDIGECHENDGVHRTSGRIFKITFGDPALPKHKDLSKLGNEELAKLLGDTSQWHFRHALRLLQERACKLRVELRKGDLTDDQKRVVEDSLFDVLQPLIERSFPDSPERSKLRLIWALHATGAATDQWLLERTRDGDEHVRAWAVRLLVDGQYPITLNMIQRFFELANQDASGLVRLNIASSLTRFSASYAFRIAAALANHAKDAVDRTQPHLIWYGIEHLVTSNPDKAIELAINSKIPLLRKNIVRRLTYEIENAPEPVDRVVQELDDATTDHLRIELLTGMWQGLEGWNRAPAPADWGRVSAKLTETSDSQIDDLVQKLSVVFGVGRAVEELRKIAASNMTGIPQRRQAIAALARGEPDPKLFGVLKPLLKNGSLANDVTRALAVCDQPEVARLILSRYDRLDPEGKSAAINTLVARDSWALQLLDAVEKKEVPVSAITSAHVRQLTNFENKQLNARLTKAWGEIRPTSAAREKQMSSLRDRLTPEVLGEADLVGGKVLFEKSCASCHVMFGQGGRIGPDLTGSDRKNLNYLLENMIDPSAVVAESFQTSVVLLEDGRLLTGVVVEQNERTLKLQTKDELVLLDRRSIEEMKKTKTSLMPDGQLDALSPSEIRDLIGFLMQ